MQETEPESQIIRFGIFEADLKETRLTKAGIKIKIQEQPFQILALLLERPGQVVSREEIRQRLWSENTFVEFDDGLNTAVRKLRAALGDPADNPRFVETVPRRGYRFIAPVSTPPLAEPAARSAPVVTRMEGPDILAPLAVEQAKTSVQSTSKFWTYSFAAIFLLMLGGLGAFWYSRQHAFHISSKDTIVLADFINSTGESVFDDALRKGLEVGLEQSPSINVLSDRKAAVLLKQMGRPTEGKMTGKTAIEVCNRAGGKITVQGSIVSLGTTYLIELAAIRCDTGDPIARQEAEAKSKDEVVDSLGKLTAQLRTRLGESLPSIQKFNAPLEQATTPSLEALNAYSLALSTWDKKGDLASVPIFKRAIDLDPNFAMAYGGLSAVYHNLNETDLAREYASKAYDLRNRVTESERISIEARYSLYVTGDIEKAAVVYQAAADDYPDSAGIWNHLGTTYASLGEYEKAAHSLRQALRLDPSRATTYANLATNLLALDQTAEAEQTLAEAAKRNLRTDFLLQVEYWLAFLKSDDSAMQRTLLEASDIPGAQPLLLATQATTEAYHGRFKKAAELSRVTVELMQHDEDKESAARCLAEESVREAEAGLAAESRRFSAEAATLSRTEEVSTLVALAAARNGDLQTATAIIRALDQQYPSATFIQHYWLPVIRAEIDLQQKHPEKAISDLTAAIPMEFATPAALSVLTLYPLYIRGEAYLAEGDGQKAAGEFQKVIHHHGLALNSPLGALAQLQLARAYVLQSDSAEARQAYQDFFSLWHDSDPDLSLLKQAKAEYGKLK